VHEEDEVVDVERGGARRLGLHWHEKEIERNHLKESITDFDRKTRVGIIGVRGQNIGKVSPPFYKGGSVGNGSDILRLWDGRRLGYSVREAPRPTITIKTGGDCTTTGIQRRGVSNLKDGAWGRG